MKSQIKINSKPQKRIAKLGNLTQSYEDVLEKIVLHVEKCDRWWVDK